MFNRTIILKRIPIHQLKCQKYSLMSLRYYKISNIKFQPQSDEKQMYNHLIKNALQNQHEIKQNSKLPLRTRFILIAVASSTAMILYVFIQYYKFQQDIKSNASRNIRRSIFLPLWLNLNLFSNKYDYPYQLKYLDPEYYNYLINEAKQFKVEESQDELSNYVNHLQIENVNYSLLEQISKNSKVKQIFGLPLVLDILDQDKFKIWIEINPNVSGLQVHLMKKKNELQNSIDFNWIIKPISFKSINDSIQEASFSLEKLKSSPDLETHDDSSGKPHQFQNEKQTISTNYKGDYQIKFQNVIIIKDSKNDSKIGLVKYLGVIDFDHLLINKGVKIVAIELNYDGINYKIM